MKKLRAYQVIIVVISVAGAAVIQWQPVYAAVAANAYIGALNSEIAYSSDAVVGYHSSGDPVVWASTATFTATGADRVVIFKNVFAGPGTFCMDSTCVPFDYTTTYLAFNTPDRNTHTFTLNNGAITFVAVTADLTPPVTTPSYSGTAGNAGWWRSAVTVALSATDPVGPNVGAEPGPATGVASTTMNGGPYTGPITFSTEGSTTFTFFSVDNRSNTEPTQSAEVRIDSIAPAASHSLSGAFGLNGWYITPVTVTLAASDATSGLNATVLDDSGYSSPATISDQGVTDHSYYAEDVAGNQSVAQGFTLQIDTAAPGTSVTSHSNGQPVAGAITLIGAATDTASGVSTVDVSIDGGGTWIPATLAGGTWSYNLDTTAFPDGPLTVLVRAADVAGHIQPTSGAGSTSISLLVDNTLPAASHSLSGTLGLAGWYVSDVIVTVTASDGGSGVGSITLNGSPYTSAVTVSAQGATSWPYFATDNAGNDSATGTVTLQIDSVPPATTIGSHVGGDPIAGMVTVTGAVSDVTSGVSMVEVSVDGGPWTAATITGGTWSYIFSTTALSDGTVTVGVRGTDVAGNVQPTSGAGATSISLLVDNTLPAVSHSLSGTLGLAGWYVSDVVVTVTANDSGSGVSGITLNGSPYTAPLTASAQGATSWPYFATDNAGNNSAVGAAAFQIDSVRPSSTITSHANGDFVSGTVALSGSVSDATSGVSGLDVSTDGGSSWTPAIVSGGMWTYSLDTTSFADGPLAIQTRAQDVAGNLQSTSGAGAAQVTVEVDNTPATGALSAPASFCPACGDTIDIAYSASDANGIAAWVLSVDGSGALANGTGAPAPGATYTWNGSGVTAGNRVLRLTITDVAGNVTQITALVTVVYPDPPTASIALTCPLTGDNGWCRAPVAVNLNGNVPGVTIVRLNYTYDGSGKTANGSTHSFAETIPAVTHSVAVSATDSLGRTSGTVSDSFKIDGEIPVIIFAGATASQLNLSVFDAHSGIVRWTVQVFDAAGASVFWTERFGAFSGVLDWLPSRSGTYEIEIFARDAAGNESGSGRRPFTVELPIVAQIVNPVVNLVAPPVAPTATPGPAQEPTPQSTAQPAPLPTRPAEVAQAVTPVTSPEAAPLVSISGIVFRDFNRDGQQNANESGVPDVEIQVIVGGEAQVISLRTSSDGSYSVDLPGGKHYLLKIVTPNGLFLTTPGSAMVEAESQGFVSFGLGHSYLAYWLLGVFGMFGLVWGASAATDRRATALRSLKYEMQQLAQQRLVMRKRGLFDE